MRSSTRIGWLAIMALLIVTLHLTPLHHQNNLTVATSRLRVRFAQPPSAKVGIKEAIVLYVNEKTHLNLVTQHVWDRPAVAVKIHQVSPYQYIIMPRTVWPADTRLTLYWRKGTSRVSLVTDDNREIRVDLSTQTLFAIKNHRVIRALPVSTGSARNWSTPTGTFWIYKKVEDDHMVGGQGDTRWDVQHVPYAQYFEGAVAIHGAWWNHTFDRPVSHGCIQVPTAISPKGPTGDPPDAEWLWHFTHLGTPVIVYGMTPDGSAMNPLPYPPSAPWPTFSKILGEEYHVGSHHAPQNSPGNRR